MEPFITTHALKKTEESLLMPRYHFTTARYPRKLHIQILWDAWQISLSWLRLMVGRIVNPPLHFPSSSCRGWTASSNVAQVHLFSNFAPFASPAF